MEPASVLEEAPPGLAPGRRLLLKREDRHELGAFKWRGALPALEAYREQGASAVVTASTGNHGAATAWAAQRTGLRAVVFMPEEVSRAKVALMESLGAELRAAGADVDEAKDAARTFAAEGGLPSSRTGPRRPSSGATRRSGARSSSSSESGPRSRWCRWATVRS